MKTWEEISATDVTAVPLKEWAQEKARQCRELARVTGNLEGYWTACAEKYEEVVELKGRMDGLEK